MIKVRFVPVIIALFFILPSSYLQAFQSSEISLVSAFPNLRFSKPVFLTHCGDGSNRIFVVEQAGSIEVFPNDRNAANPEIFLDIRDRVNANGSEMGLLGLAFHPDFSNNGFFYVDYTAGDNETRRTVISRFSVTSDPNQADPNSEQILLEVSQPFSNHNAGMIQFGSDGFLYIALGDGGSGGDPLNNGQNLTTLLAAILRIDVDNPSANLNYSIPDDNPFVGNTQGFREEIWAYGLRNPYRFSIDPVSGELWAGDVGQNAWEEIDLIEKGKNYGWNIMEGFHCYNSSNCNMTGLTLPIVEYSHNFGCSVTGGYIYQGALRPELQGAYIYGDYCSGRIWMLRYENGQIVADSLLLDTSLSISSFGLDETNELFIIDYSTTGSTQIYRFEESSPTGVSSEIGTPTNFTLQQNYPNPFNPSTVIHYRLASPQKVQLQIYNLAGEKIKTLVDATQAAGNYDVSWNGKDENSRQVASGIYLYKLQAGDYVLTRKMILRK